uniref:C-type lectin domain-containing protein n=1 Tax=Neolamprologus brichardi TaxID=32507 RepID=A0A3Q4GUR8_NEOBR
MLWLLVLQLINSFQGLSGFEHETLCTSNACFTAHMKKERFDKAKEDCDKRGGYLMTIRDRKEEDVLRSLLSLIKSQRHGTLLEFWIGLKLKETDCVFPDQPLRGFKWVSGNEESHYSNWKEEPASTCLAERCVNIDYNFSSENHLKWTAVPCKKRKAFYACKFYFKGMCEPLSFPHGTFAIIRCSDQEDRMSLEGYELEKDGLRCRIKDLCSPDTCEHQCVMKAGYDICPEGFLKVDGNFCEDPNEGPVTTPPVVAFVKPPISNNTLKAPSVPGMRFLWIWIVVIVVVIASIFVIRFYVVKRYRQRENSNRNNVVT